MEMTIRYEGGRKFLAECRGRAVTFDLPLGMGGKDTSLTPSEGLVASLGSCIGVYVVPFCEKNNIATNGMTIKMEWEKARDPERISLVRARIILPDGKVGEKEKALLHEAEHCFVHNTLVNPPRIGIALG